ncbi:IkappaB kinase complex, IKAP component [Polychaeton citri CBS 116435]|uniref:Elongator complex protein 1 n=1 Tax=Polychaeton citri CBS 116435 TaxID=1314669 RepID=A0A9P4UM36_9PEZI|nr:IkappaB kinase complex, IKAP component [Polychaeton citri CBS 116435]
MRNLINYKHAIISLGGDQAAPLTAAAWDASDDSLIVAFGPFSASPTVTLKRFQQDAYSPDEGLEITSWDAPSPNPDIAVDKILDIHCFPDTKTICLILAAGDIIVVREEPLQGEDVIEIVGSVDAGIAAAAWSPDEELLALCTRANTFLFMTRDFEAISNVLLSSVDVRVSNHVSVGWGKRETQFQGRGAKALRDPTVPEHVDEGQISKFDDENVTISWRGDGQFLALNSILESESRRRIIRVFSREGVLEDVSEAVDNLEGALSWKPSGQLIAGIQRFPDRMDVVFFEKNGLRHGQFSLRLSQEEVDTTGSGIQLKWNADSSVIGVVLRDRIQLWTMGNYHYYLKQDIPLRGKGKDIAALYWHPEKSLHCAYLVTDHIASLQYTSIVSKGSVSPPNDEGIVSVIDGRTLKITPLRFANVPAPMALEELELSSAAVDLALGHDGKTLAVLHQTHIALWECSFNMKNRQPTRLRKHLSLDTAVGSTVRQISLLQSGSIVLLQSLQNSDKSQLTYVDPSTGATHHTQTSALCSIASNGKEEQVICHRQDGDVSLLLPETYTHTEVIAALPKGCIQTGLRDSPNDRTVFGLTAGGVLYIKGSNHDLQISGVTSFVSTPVHLIYTTAQHLLKFIHLGGAILEIPLDEPEKDERCRSIERGARIVTVIPSAYSLVLQMPRGNLETIYPRALILAGVRRDVDVKDYKKAFLSCRTHRVDMNILHDYKPSQFTADVELVVKQLKKVEYIDLLLSSLSEDDVSQTMYKETLQLPGEDLRANGTQSEDISQTSLSSKVNRICDRFIEVLSKQRTIYLQSIVTAYVSKNPPDLENGLKLLSQLSRTGNQAELDQGIEHICFLADTNQLYDTALGQYDLDLTLLIAQQSQKDPREYLPYLQGLNELPQLRQRFAIDNDLKRYRKALHHLQVMDAFDEVKLFVEKHELYSAAIELYRYDNSRLIELMRLYAEYLSSRNRYEDAGMAYEYVTDYKAAYECYRSASLWRECLAAARLAGISESEISSSAYDLAEGLEEIKDFDSAATLHLEYLNSLEDALRALCKGYLFAEAMRLAASRSRTDLLATIVDQGLVDGASSMTEMLAEMKTQLAAQVPRLRELRQKRAEDPMAFLDSGEADVDAPDNISLAHTEASTSAGTFLTRYTNRSIGTLATNATRKTSKNKRREERKRARGKKGTVYEEEYLVNSIGRLVERINTISEDIERLTKGLMRRAMRERAAAVQSAFSDVYEACRVCMSEVFQTQQPQLQDFNHEGGQGGMRPVGGQGVLWDAITASSQQKDVPVLKAFEKLSLVA